MQVFISWSGDHGRQIAEVFKWWLPKVIQAIKPFISTQDIGKGDFWNQKLGTVLAEYQFGIAIITPDSLTSPWMNFEAGALSKNLGISRFMPILFAVEDSDLGQLPLNQFQNTKFEEDDVRKLVKDLNALQAIGALAQGDLEESFLVWWPQLLAKVEALDGNVAGNSAKAVKPKLDDRLDNIDRALSDLTRMMRRLRSPASEERHAVAIPSPVPAGWFVDERGPYRRRRVKSAEGFMEERLYEDGRVAWLPQKKAYPAGHLGASSNQGSGDWGGDDSSQINDTEE